MPRLLNNKATLACGHRQVGKVQPKAPAQDYVRIDGSPVLVGNDPVGRRIDGCPAQTPVNNRCNTTLAVTSGHSHWLFIDGVAICLGTIVGFTDGDPRGAIEYAVTWSGQEWVTEA